MSVRDQNRVCFWRQTAQSIVNTSSIRLNSRTKCYAQEIHAREVRVDKQGVTFEFKLVTVRAEISYAYAVARCAGVANNQVRIRFESRTEGLRGESEKKQKTAHSTMDTANATNVEEEDASPDVCVGFFFLDKAGEAFVASRSP